MKPYDYETTLFLKHNEKAAIIDKSSGEVKEVKFGNNSTMIKHDRGVSFKKLYTEQWGVLKTMTTPRQYLMAFQLAQMARAFTNSLQPLNPDSSARELEQILEINKSQVKKDIKVLHGLGVIGYFSTGEFMADTNMIQIAKYWIFNPYLAFNGSVVHSDIAKLFKKTIFAKLH